jgi:hypothetical protein
MSVVFTPAKSSIILLNPSAIKGFEGAKKWATENNIKEVLEQISIYEKALKDVEDDDEAVQEKFIFLLQL